MHCLSIVFNAGSPVMWKLLYREKSAADDAMRTLHYSDLEIPSQARCSLSDDFGQSISIKYAELTGFMLEDLDQSKLAHIEMSLHEAKTRAKANQMAQADPGLRTAQMMGGPPMLSPMGNGRM